MQESVKESKTTKYCRMFLHSLCVFCSVHGCNVITETFESITPGLLSMIVLNIWVPNRVACLSSGDEEVKQMIVGITRLLVENVPVVVQKPEVWCSLLQTVWVLLDQTSSSSSSTSNDNLFQGGDDDDEAAVVGGGGGVEFDSAYSKLAYATIPSIDPCVDINSGIVFFTQRFAQFIQNNNQFVTLISQALEPQAVLNFQALLAKHSH